jgi:Transposase and inactivated derivatives
MPFIETSIMSQKREFVRLASAADANLSELCRRYGISRQTGHKLLKRYAASGEAGLEEQSRKPHSSPRRSSDAMEAAVLLLRAEHPCWGGRKIAARLKALGQEGVPSASTVTAILRRHDRLGPGCSNGQAAFVRFEHEAPNRLWQMDFKGHFAAGSGRCHPLTVLDDHSRFSLCLAACADERGETVQSCLTATFRRYGLPDRMTMDNGAPWGDGPDTPYTPLTVWLMRLGIKVGHSRPYHPQTQGKDERFHRSLKAEVLTGRSFCDLAECQQAFDHWRTVYNEERPHEALNLMPPICRYQPAIRSFPEILPTFDYAPDDHVRKVQDKGWISFKGHSFKLPKAFKGQKIAIRPTDQDGLWKVWFGTQALTQVDLHERLR